MVALFVLSVRPWAMDRDFYTRAVTDDRLYALMKAPELAQDAEKKMMFQDYIFHGPSLVSSIQKNLPEAELKALGIDTINQVMDALEGKRSGQLRVNLVPLKMELQASLGPMAAEYARSLPRLAQLPAPKDYSAIADDKSVSQLTAETETVLRGLVQTIPDTAVSEGSIHISGSFNTSLGQAALNRTAWTLSLLAIGTIIGLAFLGGGSMATILSRAGGMVGFPSVVVLIFGAVLALPGARIVQQLLPPQAQSVMGKEFGDQLRAYLSTILGPMSQGFFLTGVVGASLGALLKSYKRFFAGDDAE
jgi:hypothetical protein